MKNVLIFCALMLTASASIADTAITVVNPSAKTSPATVFGHGFKSAVNASFYQAADCEDAGRKFSRTENAVMIYNSSIEFAARNKGLKCGLTDVKNKRLVYTGQTYMKLCRLPGTSHQFNSTKSTLGMASMYATEGHENKFKAAGANIKIVPYSGSKSVMVALYAGDIDIGWMGSGLVDKQGDKLDCIASTDPSASNYIGNQLKLAIPDFRIQYVVYTNSNDPSVINKLKAAQKNAAFNKFLNKSNTTGSWIITNTSESSVVKYVDLMFSNWADKK